MTGGAALEYVQRLEEEVKGMASLLKSTPEQLRERLDRLLREQRQKERELESLKSKILSSQTGDLLAGVREVGGIRVLAREVGADSPKDLRDMADQIGGRLGSGIIVLGARKDDKAMLLCKVSKDLAGRHKAGDLIGKLSEMVGGKGGGRPDMAQGGGTRPDELGRALEAVYELVAGR
jgi:alanyl-tRNA synthetase